MALTGLWLVVSPNTLLALVHLPPVNDGWIRLLGMFMIIVAFYYFRTANSEVEKFFRATVYGRTFMGFFMVWLGLTQIGWVLAAFAIPEWIGAGLTWAALRKSGSTN